MEVPPRRRPATGDRLPLDDAGGKPLPDEQQDKRTVVALEREHWEQWLHGSPADAAALIRLPATDLYAHGAADPEKHVPLPVAA